MNLPVDISDVHGTAVKNAARLAIRGVVNTLEGQLTNYALKNYYFILIPAYNRKASNLFSF